MRNWLRNPMHALSMAFPPSNKVYFAKKEFCCAPSTPQPILLSNVDCKYCPSALNSMWLTY